MNAKRDRVFKELFKALYQANNKGTSGYDTTAEVVRVEGDTVWVHIPGGVDETPVKKTIDAVKGDTVQLRVSGGTAWIVGNETKPPTDDRVANVAKKTAKNANLKALTAQQTAEKAKTIADNTNQYFWFTSEGTDTGAHIAEIPQSEFTDPTDPNYQSGGNLLARSNGIAVRNGLTELATFGANGAQIGVEGQSRLIQDFHSLQMIDKEGNPYFYVSDLRDASGEATLTYTDVVDDRISYYLPYMPTSIISVTINGQTASYIWEEGVQEIEITSAIAQDDILEVVYTTESSDLKAYTLGTRDESAEVGAFSYAEGVGVEASGAVSHAQGFHTKAQGTYQTVMGKYNNLSDPYYNYHTALIVGNGDSDNARSNALAMDWNGNVRIKGDVYVGCNGDSTGGTKLGVSETPTITDSGDISAVEVNTGTTFVNLASVTLDKGVYILTGIGVFPNNSSGRRGLAWGSEDYTYYGASLIAEAPASGGVTRLQTVLLISIPNDGYEMKLNCYQTSGSKLNVSSRYRIMKLG